MKAGPNKIVKIDLIQLNLRLHSNLTIQRLPIFFYVLGSIRKVQTKELVNSLAGHQNHIQRIKQL